MMKSATHDEALQWCVDNVTEWSLHGLADTDTPDGWKWDVVNGLIILDHAFHNPITFNEWLSVKPLPMPHCKPPLPDTVKAHDVLQRGIDHMRDRATTYDSPQGERSMGKTVKAFNVITGRDLTEEEGWLFMELLKQVRSVQGDFKLDNYEDLAAYAGLRAEAAHNERSDK